MNVGYHMQISVLNVCGPICADPDDGVSLCDQARQVLGTGDTVELDFSGVSTLTSGRTFTGVQLECLRPA